MRDTVTFGNATIDYQVKFVDRKTLGIQVHPDKSVHVLAPLETSTEKVREKVKSKAGWILKQQDFFLAFHPMTPARKFVSGETHLYLGKQYRLKVTEGKSQSVKLSGGYINVVTKLKSDTKAVERQLKKWYTDKAKTHIDKVFEECKPKAERFTKIEPTLHYRWMKKRWGSCDKDGKIHLNLELIKAPKSCIEYVVIHEMCHLLYLNHSKAFYDLLEEVYPNWKKTKDKLEKLMV